MVKYHSVQPQNLRSDYGEFSQLDFDLVYTGKLRLNTLRFHAQLKTPSADVNGATFLSTDNTRLGFYYDNLVGGHSFIDSITTTFSEGKKAGVVENLQSYSRYVKMSMSATQGANEQFQSAALTEGRLPNLKAVNTYMRGTQTGFSAVNVFAVDTTNEKFNFSLKPMICLNTASAPNGMPHVSTRNAGSVRVSIRLARNAHVFFGGDASAAASYLLENCRMTYMSDEDDGQDMPVVMNTKLNIKKSVNANSTQLSVRIPALVNSVSCSFLDQAKQNELNDQNTLELQRPEAISRVVFSFNDTLNRYTTFELDQEIPILAKYLESFRGIDANSATIGKLKGNDGYGIGCNFGQYIDLENQRFGIDIQSNIGAAAKVYILYAYFHSLIEI